MKNTTHNVVCQLMVGKNGVNFVLTKRRSFLPLFIQWSLIINGRFCQGAAFLIGVLVLL